MPASRVFIYPYPGQPLQVSPRVPQYSTGQSLSFTCYVFWLAGYRVLWFYSTMRDVSSRQRQKNEKESGEVAMLMQTREKTPQATEEKDIGKIRFRTWIRFWRHL